MELLPLLVRGGVRGGGKRRKGSPASLIWDDAARRSGKVQGGQGLVAPQEKTSASQCRARGKKEGEPRPQSPAGSARPSPQETCPPVPPSFTTSWGLGL